MKSLAPPSSGRMPAKAGAQTLTELTDTPSSLAGQAGNALRVNSVEAAYEFYDTGYAITPWWEWNGVDMTQFDAVVEGAQVAGHVAQVVTYRGFNWIELAVTSAGGATTGPNAGIVLPITQTPPSADYVIAFDFVSITVSSNVVGACGVVRFVDMSTAYFVRYNNRAAAPIQDFGKFKAVESIDRFEDMDDPRLGGLNVGVRMAVSIQAGDQGVGALAKMIVGEPTLYIDSAPHTAVGRAGLFQTTGGLTSTTTRNYYRNVRCYRASEVEQFEL